MENQRSVFKDFKGEILFSIPSDMLKTKAITSVDVLVYMVIHYLSYKTGYCWATNETIAESINVSSKTVSNSIGKLEALNYIARSKTVSNGMPRRRLWTVSKAVEVKTQNDRKNIDLSSMYVDYDWLNDEMLVDGKTKGS